jgi:ATP-binding cassette subfamily C protein CydCD
LNLVGRRTVAVMGLFGSITAVALVLMAEGVARGVVAAIAGDDLSTAAALLAGGGILRALSSWGSQAYATRAGIGAKEKLRRDLAGRVLENRGGRAGSLAAVGSLGLDELDAWYRTVLPAMTTTATIPLIVGARILAADWLSALIIVLTVPLVPVFMALVGLHTKDQTDAASATLQRLSDHLVELARGLPVLVGLGRLAEQTAALRRVSDAHRATTVRTLRTAFLSSLVLELIATISVAVVAVAVGLRLINGDLSLEVGLIALVLAPECFAPFRALGSAFHASQEGLAAMRRAREVIDAPSVTATMAAGGFGADNLTLRSIESLSFDLPVGSITLVEGPSGSGKSTLLDALAGIVPLEGGTLRGIDSVGYVPQHPRTVGDTVRDELLIYGDDVDALMHRLRLPNTDPTQLSPGELRRLAVARGVLRVQAGATLLLLDEPTAHLDSASADLVERELELLRGRVTMVIASHEQGVARLADRRIVLAPSTFRTEERIEPVEAPARVSTNSTRTGTALPELLAFLRPTARRFAFSVLLGTASTLFAITLLAVSGWLIVRASEEPAIMYLLVAIVGVRFFGIGRAVLRYCERLLTHDASLGSVTALRLRLWNGLAALGPASRGLTTGGVALDYLVGASDRVRDLVPRVVLPIVTALASTVAIVIAVGALHAPALPVLLVIVAALAVAPLVAVAADRRAASAEGAIRSTVLRRFTALVEAAPDLAANGVGDRVRNEIGELDSAAGAQARRGAIALGLGGAIVIVACATASALMLGASAGAPSAIVAVLVLLPLGLIEPLIALVDAAQQWPALASALRKVGNVASSASPPNAPTKTGVQTLELRDLATTWPGASAPAFAGVSATAARGDWIVVEGASGSGKSTLLATVLGFVPASSGAVLFDGRAEKARVAWCPQEGHLFDSTIRGNLLLSRPKDDKPTDAELRAALTGVGLAHDLDQRVGSHGAHLSGGERQRLAVARALLTRADVVLLDEPTAHLDAEAASDLMRDLREALADRIVLLVTHHADEARPGDIRVRLGAVPILV